MQQKEQRTGVKRHRMPCPHCGTSAKSTKTNPIDRLYYELTLRCENDECMFTFVASMAPVRVLQPSLTPHPDVRIPISQRCEAQAAHVV